MKVQRDDVVERCRLLQAEVRQALTRLDGGDRSAAVVDGVWSAEALGTLLWALSLRELPPYDRPFPADEVARATLDGASLRPADELDAAHEAARLWHWRARTAVLVGRDELLLPSPYGSSDQLVAATAMRGFDHALLPEPVRGDFGAFETAYRLLDDEELTEAHSLALERHQALAWLTGRGEWDALALDT